MKTFQYLRGLGYAHYLPLTVHELDTLPIGSEERTVENALAFRFFRENYGLEGTVMSWTEQKKVVWYFSVEKVGKPNRYKAYECSTETFEEAEFKCLEKLIEIAQKWEK